MGRLTWVTATIRTNVVAVDGLRTVGYGNVSILNLERGLLVLGAFLKDCSAWCTQNVLPDLSVQRRSELVIGSKHKHI